MTRRVPVDELVDLARLTKDGASPSQRSIREALPRGWVLEPDGRTARRDWRIMAREGWILVLALVVFGSVGLGLLWHGFPRGSSALARLGILVAIVLVTGGIVAPMITRTLHRR